MKKNDVEIGAVVEVRFDGGVTDGIVMEKDTFRATIDLTIEAEDGAGKDVFTGATVSVPYKDILGLSA